MPIRADILWSFLSLVSLGVGDFLGRQSSVRIGSLSTAFYVQITGLALPTVILAAQAAFQKVDSTADLSTAAWLGPAVGFTLAAAYLVYYRGLAMGKVSVVTAVASAWLAVSVLLAWLLLGEVIAPPQWGIIGAITCGILMLSARGTTRGSGQTGFWYGVGAMLTIGMAAALIKPLSLATTPILAILVSKVFTLALLLVVALVQRAPVSWPGKGSRGIVAAAGLLDSLGFIAYSIGLTTGSVFTVAPITAAHSIVTMSLAWLFLHERPARIQALGIAITMAGVIGLSATTGG